MNVLLNSLGQLFRNGLNNMLGIVSGATPSISIYDGAGNADSNIVARFASNLIELGKGSATAVVEFCGGLGRIGYNSGHYQSFVIDGNGHQVIVTGGSQPAFIASDGGYVGADANGAFLTFDSIEIYNIDESIYETYTTAEVVGAIPVTLFDNDSASPSATTTLSETAANFSRLTIFYKDSDNNRSSVDVWAPDGKRVSLSLTWINGTSTQQMYQRVRYVTISGTTIETSKLSGDAKYRTGQVQLGATSSVTNSDYISITHVIGYR